MLEMMRLHKEEFTEFHRKKDKERKKVAGQARDLYEKRKKNEDEEIDIGDFLLAKLGHSLVDHCRDGDGLYFSHIFTQ